MNFMHENYRRGVRNMAFICKGRCHVLFKQVFLPIRPAGLKIHAVLRILSKILVT